MTAVARQLRVEKAALGDAVAAEAEATLLHREQQLLIPKVAAEAAEAAAALGIPEWNGPWCSSSDPYSIIPMTFKMALSLDLNMPTNSVFMVEMRMFSVGRLLYIMVPPLDLFEFLYWILAIFTPFLGGAVQVVTVSTTELKARLVSALETQI